MLVMTGGRERTAGAFAALRGRTRWRIDDIVQTASPLSGMIAAPAAPS